MGHVRSCCTRVGAADCSLEPRRCCSLLSGSTASLSAGFKCSTRCCSASEPCWLSRRSSIFLFTRRSGQKVSIAAVSFERIIWRGRGSRPLPARRIEAFQAGCATGWASPTRADLLPRSGTAPRCCLIESRVQPNLMRSSGGSSVGFPGSSSGPHVLSMARLPPGCTSVAEALAMVLLTRSEQPDVNLGGLHLDSLGDG